MKRVLQLYLYMMVIGTALLGCQQGVTDVGNPVINKPPAAAPGPESPSMVMIPQIKDLPGNYRLLNPSSATPKTAMAAVDKQAANPTTTPSACPTPEGTMPQVILGNQPSQIILFNFLSYSPDTQVATAIYNAGAFSISDSSVSVTCTGQASFVNEVVRLTLQCQVGADTSSQCTSLFQKE